MKGNDRAVVETVTFALVKQAVADWESCVKAKWKGRRRELKFLCGGILQDRFRIAAWIKDFVPQSHSVFRLSAERMAEEMATEYERSYEAMRRAENAYARCELYPYWNTKGLQQKKAEIIDRVEKRLVEERKQRRGKPI